MEIARSSVEHAVQGREANLPATRDDALLQLAGAFVTLRRRGELRGCIGLVEPTLPLWQSVERAAALAATQDFRFTPLQLKEIPEIRLEISVLSPLEEVKDLSTIQVGTHGLVAEQGMSRGLLLPQVAREYGWDREEFLSYTCEKAGLSSIAWMQGAAIQRFTAEIFGEEEENPKELYLHLKHEDALKLLQRHLKTPNLVKHCLAVEAALGETACALEEDRPKWRLCGLLHDIDYDLTADDPHRHTLAAEEILLREGIDSQIIEAIKGHNDLAPRHSLLAKTLWAADPLTGFLVACALVAPDKKLAGVDVPFVLNRMKEKAFARAVSREQIASCEQFGLSVESFISLGLKAMRRFSSDLGL